MADIAENKAGFRHVIDWRWQTFAVTLLHQSRNYRMLSLLLIDQ